MLYAAIIGCGTVASVHACALSHLSNVKLAACADIRMERAQKMADEYGAHAYDSMEKLLANEQIDVVHLCTPHHLHVPMASYAANRGVHVFSEKPPAITREQWQMLQDAALKVRIGICFQNRYNGSVQKIKSLIDQNALGSLKGARAFVTWSRDKAYYTESGWRGSLQTEGGGVLINQAIHTLDLIIYLLGKPENVSATLSNHHLQGVIEVEDTVEAYMTIKGAPALLHATTAYCENAPVFIEIAFENAKVRMEKETVEIAWNSGVREHFEYSHDVPVPKDYWGAAHIPCIRDFYNAMEMGMEPPIGVKQILHTFEALMAIYGR